MSISVLITNNWNSCTPNQNEYRYHFDVIHLIRLNKGIRFE